MGWKERNEFSAQPRSLQQQNNSHNWFLLSWENFIDSLSLSLSHQRPSLPLFAINVCLISSAFPSLSLSLALSLFLCLQHLVHIGAILSFTLSGLTSSLSLSLLTLVYCPSLLCTLTLFFTPPPQKNHTISVSSQDTLSLSSSKAQQQQQQSSLSSSVIYLNWQLETICIGKNERQAERQMKNSLYCFFKKIGQPRPLSVDFRSFQIKLWASARFELG